MATEATEAVRNSERSIMVDANLIFMAFISFLTNVRDLDRGSQSFVFNVGRGKWEVQTSHTHSEPLVLYWEVMGTIPYHCSSLINNHFSVRNPWSPSWRKHAIVVFDAEIGGASH